MILYLVSLGLGLYLLFKSADSFVTGATHVSSHYKLSPLFIGMVIIGFGTSFPELFVSTMSAYLGQDDIAIGNAYGSNIVNIAIILGITAMIKPIKVKSSILRKELLALLVVTFMTTFLLQDLKLSRLDACLLLTIFAVLFLYAVKQSRRKADEDLNQEVIKNLALKNISIKHSFLMLFGGLALLILSSRLFSWAAVSIAKSLGVSDVIIGFTIVAIGTSMPELISSVVAARKGESDLAFGNIIGSNLFNTLIVVPVAVLIKPLSIANVVLHRDIAVMCFVTFILLIFGMGFKREGRINRVEGAVLILIYIVYSWYLISK